MTDNSSDLPPGFVIREPSGGFADLPAGFVIRQPDAAPASPTERPSVFEQIRTGFGRGVRMGLDSSESTPGGSVIPSFAQGALSGGAGLVGGALELAPGAVGRAGAAISRFAQEQGQEA